MPHADRASDGAAACIRRVIFVVEFPFNDRDWERFGLETLRRVGFDIEVWDITAISHPEILDGLRVTLTASGFAHVVFADRQSATSAVAALDASAFVMAVVAYAPGSFFLFRALTKSEVRFGLLANNAIHPFSGYASHKRLLSTILSLTPARAWRSAFHRIPPRLFGVRPADTVFMATDYALENCIPIGPRTVRVAAHAFDYDIFHNRAAAGSGNGKFAVFLDEFLPFHPDWAAYGESPARPDVYYPRIRAFFDTLEAASGVPIVVAAHPRAHYDEPSFGDRQVIHGKTAELVCRSRFVVAQASQSVGFAAMAEKPVVFLTMDAFTRTGSRIALDYGRLIERIAASFGKVPFNVDGGQALDFASAMRVDRGAYAAFRAQFIKRPGSPERPFWDIVADYLKELPC